MTRLLASCSGGGLVSLHTTDTPGHQIQTVHDTKQESGPTAVGYVDFLFGDEGDYTNSSIKTLELCSVSLSALHGAAVVLLLCTRSGIRYSKGTTAAVVLFFFKQ